MPQDTRTKQEERAKVKVQIETSPRGLSKRQRGSTTTGTVLNLLIAVLGIGLVGMVFSFATGSRQQSNLHGTAPATTVSSRSIPPVVAQISPPPYVPPKWETTRSIKESPGHREITETAIATVPVGPSQDDLARADSAQKAIEPFNAISSATDVGTNHDEYRQKLADCKTALSEYLDRYGDKDSIGIDLQKAYSQLAYAHDVWETAEEGIDGKTIFVYAPKYKGLMAILFKSHPALRSMIHKDPEPESDEHPNQSYLSTSDFLPYFWNRAAAEIAKAKSGVRRLTKQS